jgi:hypothetical protein
VKESNLGQIHKNQQNLAQAGLETDPDQFLGHGRAGFCWARKKTSLGWFSNQAKSSRFDPSLLRSHGNLPVPSATTVPGVAPADLTVTDASPALHPPSSPSGHCPRRRPRRRGRLPGRRPRCTPSSQPPSSLPPPKSSNRSVPSRYWFSSIPSPSVASFPSYPLSQSKPIERIGIGRVQIVCVAWLSAFHHRQPRVHTAPLPCAILFPLPFAAALPFHPRVRTAALLSILLVAGVVTGESVSAKSNFQFSSFELYLIASQFPITKC